MSKQAAVPWQSSSRSAACMVAVLLLVQLAHAAEQEDQAVLYWREHDPGTTVSAVYKAKGLDLATPTQLDLMKTSSDEFAGITQEPAVAGASRRLGWSTADTFVWGDNSNSFSADLSLQSINTGSGWTGAMDAVSASWHGIWGVQRESQTVRYISRPSTKPSNTTGTTQLITECFNHDGSPTADADNHLVDIAAMTIVEPGQTYGSDEEVVFTLNQRPGTNGAIFAVVRSPRSPGQCEVNNNVAPIVLVDGDAGSAELTAIAVDHSTKHLLWTRSTATNVTLLAAPITADYGTGTVALGAASELHVFATTNDATALSVDTVEQRIFVGLGPTIWMLSGAAAFPATPLPLVVTARITGIASARVAKDKATPTKPEFPTFAVVVAVVAVLGVAAFVAVHHAMQPIRATSTSQPDAAAATGKHAGTGRRGSHASRGSRGSRARSTGSRGSGKRSRAGSRTRSAASRGSRGSGGSGTRTGASQGSRSGGRRGNAAGRQRKGSRGSKAASAGSRGRNSGGGRRRTGSKTRI